MQEKLPEETFYCSVTDLKLKAQSCDFGELKDSMVRDQIVNGIHDNELENDYSEMPN